MNTTERAPYDTGSDGLAAALQRAADVAALAGAWVAGLCILGLTLLVLLDTSLALVSRFIPSLPSGTGIGWEYSAYMMGAAFLLGSGMTLRAGLQLRVELALSSRRKWLVRAFETFSAALGATVTCSLTVWLTAFAYRTWGYGEVSDSFTPLWIPQAVLALGAAVLAFQMVARFVACLVGNPLNRPDLGAASAIE